MALMTVLAGCSNHEEPSTKTEKASDTAQTSAVETTEAETIVTRALTTTDAVSESVEETLFKNCGASNLVNSGICCTDGDRYYYSDTNTQKLYQTKNGTADMIADQFYGYYLNLCGDIIYYADAAADNCVTAYDLTSGNRTVICNMHVQELTLYKEKLYFTCTDGKQRTIYRMNTDGSCLESLASCEDLWYMTIYKDVVYYVNYENDQYAIISMSLDGTDSKIIRKYNASDLCIAEDKIFFAERDTRYLYSMNLDGSDVHQLNSTYSRCINYMNGQLYYYGSEENGRNIYSCDLSGNITGRYASGAKFLMLMEDELYYYDWDEVLHILPLSKKSEDENTSYGTNIVSYEQEEILKPIRLYIQNNWTGYILDESNITKKGNTWTILLTESDGSKQYQLTIDLTTGKITILCITDDILPVSVYLFDNEKSVSDSPSSEQLSEEEMKSLLTDYCVPIYTGMHYTIDIWQLEYHDYDGNGTYEAFAICGHSNDSLAQGHESCNIVDAVLFISSTGEITVVNEYRYDLDRHCLNIKDGNECYIEYDGTGCYLPSVHVGVHIPENFISYDMMFGLKNGEPYEYDNSGCGWTYTDSDGEVVYEIKFIQMYCPECVKMENVDHKHVLIYDKTNGEFEIAVKYPSGEVIKFDDLRS